MVKPGKRKTPPTGRDWTAEELEALYDALQTFSKSEYQNLNQALTEIEGSFQKDLKNEDSQPNKNQIKVKLTNLAKTEGLSGPVSLISDWPRWRKQVANRDTPLSSPTQQSPTTSPKAKRPRTRDNSDSPRSATPCNDKSSSAGNVGQPVDDGSRRPSSGGTAGALVNDSPATSDQQRNSAPTATLGGFYARLAGAQEVDYPRLQEEIINGWHLSRFNKHYGPSLAGPDAHHAFRDVLSHINEGITSFCKAHPIAYLTLSKVTNESLQVAQSLYDPIERTNLERSLKVLFGDPLLSSETVLRAFAAAAIYNYAFGDSFRSLPSKRPDHARGSSLGGSFLEFCKKGDGNPPISTSILTFAQTSRSWPKFYKPRIN